MGLSFDIISQFAKLTSNKKEVKDETTSWGEVVQVTDGKYFVKLDGSERVTPVTSMTEAKVGDRVSVTVRNHAATLTGNTSSPAVTADGSTISSMRTDFDNLSADNVTIRGQLTANEAYISELSAENVVIKNTLQAQEADIENLHATTLKADVAKLTYATIESLNAVNASIYNLNTVYATISNLNATNAEIDKLRANYATIASLNAVDAKIGNLNADVGEINKLIFGSASGEVIQTSFANAVVAQLGDAQIKSAMIQDIAASKITSGNIITNNVQVKSEDGKLLIADQTIQISDDMRVRVQIGKDANNDYSINIWDADGKLMFSEGGLTEDAVKKQIIRNDMVKDDANISANKLDISSLFTVINEDGTHTLKSSKVKIDSTNQTLDVAFGALTTKVDGQEETISSHGTAISIIQGNISSKIWQQDITTAINNISIGGTNLVKNTKNPSDTSYWTRGKVIKDDELNENVFYMTNSATVETTAGTYRIKVVGGEWYTVSALVKRTENVKSIDFFFLSRKESDTTDFVYVQHKSNMIPEANKWVRLTWSFEMYSEAEEGYLRIDHNGSNDGTESVLYYTNIKVEKGQKATDWSPSPEDIQQDITTLNTRYSTLNQTINGLSQTVGDHTTQIANKADGSKVTEVSDAVRSLESTLDVFRSDVSATYTTKTEFNGLTDDVDSLSEDFANLSVGGRNLVANTSLDTVYSGVRASESVTKDVWSAKTISVLMEDEYIVSFDAKADEDVEVSCFFYSPNTTLTSESSTGDKRTGVTDGHSKVAISTEWKRYWVKWTQNGSETTTTKSVIVGRNYSDTNRVYIRAVKLEVGNKATDWTPAPEDTADKITSLTTEMSSAKTRIEQNEKDILLRATQVEVKEVDNKFGSYYTIAETEAKIQEASDAINLTVSSISSELNESYGKGRNLLRNTGGGELVSMAYANASPAISNLPTRTNENGVQTLTGSATNLEIYYRFMQVQSGNMHGLVPGETYTLAGKVKVATESGAFSSIKVRNQYHIDGSSWLTGSESILEPIITEDSEEWVDFCASFKIPQEAKGYYISFQLYFAGDLIKEGSWSGTIQFKELKLEKGNKRTPWSVAPEDTTSITSRLSTAESGVKVLQNSVSLYATKTEVKETFAGYYTKVDTDSRIDLASNSIIQTVSATYATQNSLESAISEINQTSDSIKLSVENISRSGRNLIHNTSQKDTVLGGYTSEIEGWYSKGFIGSPTIALNRNECVMSFEAKSTVDGDAIHCYFYKLEGSQTVYSETSQGEIATNIYGESKIVLSMEWKRYWIKYTHDDSARGNYYEIGRRCAGHGTGIISIRCVKLEEGHNPTPWSAAPEDARRAFAEDSSTVTITSGSITFKTGTLVIDTNNFTLDADGKITATEAVIKGDITSESETTKAELTGGGLSLYQNGKLRGLITSKYYPGAADSGLALTVPDGDSGGLRFVAADTDLYGDSFVVYYQLQPSHDTIEYCYQDGGRIHTFEGSVMFFGTTYHYTPSFFRQAIYLKNTAVIGWQTVNSSSNSPTQFISYDSTDGFIVGSTSNKTQLKGTYITITGENYVNLENKEEMLILEGLSTVGTYSGYFYSCNANKCCLGKSSNRWYRLYAANDCSISSDRRLKKNIEHLSDIHTSLFNKLQPVQYNFIEDDERIHYGLIAQDVISAMAELGIDENDLDLVQHDMNVNESGELNDTYGIAYGNLIPMLIHEVQKLKSEIKILKGE